MIKKLHQLKAKKGFTLVELLVVIAIIGILAAILIPLMSNFMRSARVQSANSTASSGKNTLTYLIQQEQIKNRGISNATGGTITIAFGPARGTIANVGDVIITGVTFHPVPVAPAPGIIMTSEATRSYAVNVAIATIQDLIRYNFERAFPDAQNCVFAFWISPEGDVSLALYAPSAVAPADLITYFNVAAPARAIQNISEGLVTAGALPLRTVVGSEPQT